MTGRYRGGGGRGECGIRNDISVVINTQIHQTHGLRQTMTVWVEITDSPVYIRERGGGGRGECGIRNDISVVINTQIHQTHGLRQTMTVWVEITDSPVYIR